MTVQTKTVVFDFGNVLLRWDVHLLYRQLIPNEQDRLTFLKTIGFDKWNSEQDRGRSWEDGIALLVSEHPDKEALIRAYHERWHETVPGAIEGTVQILERLKQAGVPLYAITNFSAEKLEECKTRFPFLKTSFIDTIVSGEVRLLKPDPAIYQLLIERNNLEPAECVFIDDSLPNVETANKLGMAGIHFISPEQLAKDLTSLGLPV